MVRCYKRISVPKTWTQENLTAAHEAVQTGTSVNRAALEHGVPRPTLQKYLLLVGPADENRNLGRFRPVFNAQQERELVKHILAMEVTLYGVTSKEMRSLAYQLAVLNKIDHPFDEGTELAGKDWLYGFRMRHPELSLRTPEATSAARAQGFNKVSVDHFYDVLEKALATGKFRKASQFWNVDETCVLTVQSKRSKILALKGRRQVGAITSAERGLLSTACIASSAGGQFIPPMLIFPRARMTDSLKKGAPPGTLFAGNPTGWMTVTMFNKWFDHFLAYAKPSAEDPLLLVLDGHASHTKNLAFIEKARQNYVTAISFPPHCSHKLQPLDVSFMAPLKTNFSLGIERFLKADAGRVVTLNDISELLGDAFLKSATPMNAISGFMATGIWPFNRHKFTAEDFAAAEVTNVLKDFAPDEEEPPCEGFGIDIPNNSSPGSVVPTPGQPVHPLPALGHLVPVMPTSGQPVLVMLTSGQPIHAIPTSGQPVPALSTSEQPVHPMPTPGQLIPLMLNSGQAVQAIPTSGQPVLVKPTSKPLGPTPIPGHQGFQVSPEAIKPLPKVVGRKICSGRRRQKAAELTSDTYRNVLKAAEANKDAGEIRKSKKRLAKANSERAVKKKRNEKPGKENLDDSLCPICGGIFSNFADGDEWEKCHSCHEWFHRCLDHCPTCNV